MYPAALLPAGSRGHSRHLEERQGVVSVDLCGRDALAGLADGVNSALADVASATANALPWKRPMAIWRGLRRG